MGQWNQVLSSESVRSLELLIKGNKRFLSGVKSIESFASTAKLKELAKRTQSPFSIVLTCADSRVPVEAIFDLGLGDLFVLRVAGNVVSPELIASVEYAASNLSTPLCLVMGHTGCGAVDAAVSFSNNDLRSPSKNISHLLEKILPSVLDSKMELGNFSREELVKLTTVKNVKTSAKAILENSSLLKNMVSQSKFAVVEAVFDLQTGVVNFDLEGKGSLSFDADQCTESEHVTASAG
jgi:carbonic anhydrase